MGPVTVVNTMADGRQRIEICGRLGPVVPGLYPSDFCYLCENVGADCEEHIVPRGIYRLSKSDREGLTLKAHRACNRMYSVDEEKLRNRLVGLADAQGATREAAMRAAASSLDLDLVKSGRDARHALRKRQAHWKEIRKEGGQYLWDPNLADEQWLYRVFYKMTRGLTYWLTAKLPVGLTEASYELYLLYDGESLRGERYRVLIRDGLDARARFTEGATRITHGDLHLTFYGSVRARVAFGLPDGAKVVP